MLKLSRPALIPALALLLAAAGQCPAQVLYDAATGTLPSAQSWVFSAFGTSAQSLTAGALVFDTTSPTSIQAGYTPVAAPVLNRAQGFTVLFTLQMLAETHTSTNRAGLSFIVLGSDKKGIEIGFWTNAVWAQSDSPLFTHAETTNLNTTAASVDYALSLGPTNYALFANAVQVLGGPVRDYTAFTGSIDPYETPNFLFFGDDTSSAQAAFALKRYVLVPAPTLVAGAPDVITWTGVSNLTYSVELSTNLLTPLQQVAAATSPTAHFAYTNTAAGPARFLRVRFP